jgi:hypothetical protein
MQELAKDAGVVSMYLMAEPTTQEVCQRLGYAPQQEWIVMGQRLAG